MSIIDKIYTNQKLYLVSLILLFLLAFAVPLIFALTVGGVFSKYMPESVVSLVESESDINEKDGSEKDSLFPNSVSINNSNSLISIKSNSSLEASDGKDFIFSFWVKFKKLPSQDENMIIISKYDDKSASRKGYSFALAREQENVRPSVYWRDENNNGTWFAFSEIYVEPKLWNLFVISFRDNKYLGLHTAALLEKDQTLSTQIKLLGGYELSTTIIPQNKSNLEIGAISAGKFRGKIGPVGIFNRKKITENLDSILKNLIAAPLSVPAFFEQEDVGLWMVNGQTDTGPKQNKIVLPKSKKTEQ